MPRGDGDHLIIELVVAPALAALAAEWRELEARADGSFFLSWSWIGTWLATLAGPTRLLRLRDGGRTVGLALLGVTDRRVLGIPWWRGLHLSTTGDPLADRITIEYNDVLAERGSEAMVRAAALGWLLTRGRVDAVVLKGVGEEVQAAAAACGAEVRVAGTSGSARVDLAALRAQGGDYLATLGSSTRGQIRRSQRLYAERGPLRIERAGSVERALAILAEAGAMHTATWAARGEAGSWAGEGFRRFHEALVTVALPRGEVELLRVTAGDETIGCLYNFLWRGHALYYFSGFAYAADNRLKPGMVAHALVIDDHLGRGTTVYDFMAGDSRYKSQLGEPGPSLATLVLERRSPAIMLERGLRALKARLRRFQVDRRRGG